MPVMIISIIGIIGLVCYCRRFLRLRRKQQDSEYLKMTMAVNKVKNGLLVCNNSHPLDRHVPSFDDIKHYHFCEKDDSVACSICRKWTQKNFYRCSFDCPFNVCEDCFTISVIKAKDYKSGNQEDVELNQRALKQFGYQIVTSQREDTSLQKKVNGNLLRKVSIEDSMWNLKEHKESINGIIEIVDESVELNEQGKVTEDKESFQLMNGGFSGVTNPFTESKLSGTDSIVKMKKSQIKQLPRGNVFKNGVNVNRYFYLLKNNVIEKKLTNISF